MKTPFRESNLDLDGTLRENSNLKKDKANLEEQLRRAKRSRIRKSFGHTAAAAGAVVGMIALIAILLFVINAHMEKTDRLEAEDGVREKVLFSAAYKWVDEHNEGLGTPWCWVDNARVNGYLRDDSLVRCHLRYETEGLPDRFFRCSVKTGTCYEEGTLGR